jgi:archaeal flagellin FlaB
MTQLTSDERKGFTGLEAAIVLIAIVVIVAMFFYVVLGTGFTPQKKSENGVKGAEQAGTIQVIGDVYGLATVPSSGINEIRFSIRLVPGAQSMDLKTMKIVFSTPATSPVMLSQGTTASTSVFTTRLNGAGDSVNSIDQDQQIEIGFFVENVPAGTVMNFDMRPPAGSLSFTRTAPATITNTNVL